jgi:hypothetical protein
VATVTDRVPSTLDEALTPSWLSAALGVRYPGISVRSVERGPVVSRVSTNARFRIECAEALPEGLPPELCIKGYFNNPAAGRAGIPETIFYREFAEATGVRTLQCHYAEVDPDTGHGVVITEDVLTDDAVARGARFLDGCSDYSVDQTAQSLAELAKLHAATWNDASLTDPSIEGRTWLAPRMEQTLRARGLPEISANFDGPIGAGVPERVRDAQRLVDVYPVLAAQVADAAPHVLMHGDTHVGNVYIDRDGNPSWLDWQVVQRGAWWVDVAYHIASALTVDDRRAHERDLLRHYLDELQALGVEPPGWDEALRDIRRGVVHGFFLWGITMKVTPQITASLLTRLGTAVDDHDSLDEVTRANR